VSCSAWDASCSLWAAGSADGELKVWAKGGPVGVAGEDEGPRLLAGGPRCRDPSSPRGYTLRAAECAFLSVPWSSAAAEAASPSAVPPCCLLSGHSWQRGDQPCRLGPALGAPTQVAVCCSSDRPQSGSAAPENGASEEGGGGQNTWRRDWDLGPCEPRARQQRPPGQGAGGPDARAWRHPVGPPRQVEAPSARQWAAAVPLPGSPGPAVPGGVV